MNPRPNGPAGAATPPEVYVATTDIRAAIKGRETDLLDALGIPWRDARPRINCPYSDHPDKDPSWALRRTDWGALSAPVAPTRF